MISLNSLSDPLAVSFDRPLDGPRLTQLVSGEWGIASGQPGWVSNGGVSQKHPARALPFTVEATVMPVPLDVTKVHLLGVFALHAKPEAEPTGTVGGLILGSLEGQIVFRKQLINGEHYCDALSLDQVLTGTGDGIVTQRIGTTQLADSDCRLDLITILISPQTRLDSITFRDMGTPASFVIFDIFVEFEKPKGCPFHSESGGIALGEIGAIIRSHDRARLKLALHQFELALLKSTDLDEVRGEALTFLAVLTAATLELGASREMHRVQLDAARLFDKLSSAELIAAEARQFAKKIVEPVFEAFEGHSSRFVEQAIALVDARYAQQLTDDQVATELGLSTSHFRFLFREATGQPFHKYVVAKRLEKAKSLLLDHGMSVTDVAQSVGFANASHFSRAFSQKFNVSPSKVRQLSR